MNKLVSKNPILRFKLGRKIVKAKWGDSAPNPLSLLNDTGDPYVGMWYDGESEKPVGTALIYNTEEVRLKDLKKPFYKSAYYFDRTPYYQILSNNIYSGPRDFINSYKQTGGHPTIDKEALPKVSKKSIKTNGGNSRKTSKSSTPTTVFAGHKIGKTGGLNYNIDDADKQQLIGTGQFTESDFTNAMSTQLALNRYFVNSGLGSVTEDGAWGDLSRAALALALSKSKSLTPFNNETTIVRTPIVPTYTPSITPINLEVANLKLNVNVPQQTYDRTGVREFIRNKGFNPYSFNGALRRALRMVLNNTADDNDKLLVKGMNIFKQGGLLLPSRNIVEKFKLGKKLLKALLGKTLPTAPKAEDRFRNGVKDSVAYLGVPGKDNSYLGESIKRVTTPDNAKIQRQVLFRYYPYDNDTIYREVPEHSKYIIYPIRTNIQPRLAFSYAKNPEYEILKRRFNTAWNLAK